MTQRPTHPAGFTLIELMVSIAIALLLILGVNEVFRIASETAGQGQTLSTINRDNRAIQNTLAEDFKSVVPVYSIASPTADGPCFVIDSGLVAAFRNIRDKAGAADPANPLHDDVLFANSQPPGYWNPALINSRSHRVDQLGFFARSLFPRQTAPKPEGTATYGGGTFVAPTTASEAWIWYGHANLPNTARAFFGPGDPNPGNTSNQVASDFFLCRQAILLTPNPYDRYFLQFTQGAALSPLGYNTQSNDGPSLYNAGPYLIQDSRYDVAQTSIQQFSAILGLFTKNSAPGKPVDWWDPLIFRYNVNPFLSKPVTAAGMAMASPCLVRGCSQFIVEFAGNFYTKDPNTGVMTNAFAPDPDGTLDFSVDLDAAGKPLVDAAGNPTGHRHIRWYGFPRDTNGDGIIDYRDVMPLREMFNGARQADGVTPVDDVEQLNNLPRPPQAPYTNRVPTQGFDYKSNFATRNSVNYSYTAAWGPTSTLPFPKLIRITIAIDDPNGRLSDAQVFEYVFQVQP